ncbi:MAG TPA: hypothetical protein VGV90_05170 [Solirubrobacteraceae bacterium]|nr:hypothetical protein [Solirubrobacteraceae bacterium]
MPRRRLLRPSPWVVAALGAVVYLLLAPPSADLAAQEYRADLGLTVWNNGWFAGHHTPGYSVLFPPLGGLLGVRVTGALAAVAAAALFAPLARDHWSAHPRAAGLAALWFAVGTTAVLLTGRLTFLLGVAIGLGALLALAYDRRLVAAVLAAATTLASPVAGLFVALAVTAWALAQPAQDRARAWAWGAAIAAAALAPVAITLVLFPQGGTHVLVGSSFWPALVASLAVAALLPARERALRFGALLYALLLIAAFALDTPLGGNATRLGGLAAGPIVLGALIGRRSPLLVAALAVAAAYWPLYPAIRDVVRASGDPSVSASYHTPLLRFLESRPGSFRVEIPYTVNHWEARHVPGARDGFPLARGWERQLDRRYGALFYDGRLDAATYRAWLDEHAVAYVAVPDVPLDAAGRDEARLVAAGLPYLREVWGNEHWRVYAVSEARPLAVGATATLTPTGVILRAPRPGEVRLRVHWTRWWRVTSGRACVLEGPGETTVVRVAEPGIVRLQARLTGSSCRR